MEWYAESRRIFENQRKVGSKNLINQDAHVRKLRKKSISTGLNGNYSVEQESSSKITSTTATIIIIIIIIVIIFIINYLTTQQHLMSFGRPIMRVSLSNLIFSYSYFLLEAE